MGKYLEVPVSAAMATADQFQKDIVIIAAWTREHDRVHITTFGREPRDKVMAATGGDKIYAALGFDLEQCVQFEDFRKHHDAARATAMLQAIQKHLPALKEMADQIIHAKRNVFREMVNDFETSMKRIEDIVGTTGNK